MCYNDIFSKIAFVSIIFLAEILSYYQILVTLQKIKEI